MRSTRRKRRLRPDLDDCRWCSRLIQHRQQLEVLFLPLGRQRPFGAESLVELRLEERRFHAAVDDVPGQDRVAGTVAEDIKPGVDAAFCNRSTPLSAVALGGLDG